MPLRLLLLPALFIVALFPTASHAEDGIDWKKGGKWSDFTSYIGTYDVDGLLKEQQVKSALDDMLKGQDVDLNTAFAVRGPIGFENDCLLIKGNEEKKGDTNRAYMEVCVSAGNVNLALFDSGKITVYTKLGDYQYLNPGMREWIYLQSVPMETLNKKPDAVQMVTKAE